MRSACVLVCIRAFIWRRGAFLATAYVCAHVCARCVCVFLALLWGDPTHRLSPTDSVFTATERQERQSEEDEEVEDGGRGK